MAYTSHVPSAKKQGPRPTPSVRNGNLVRLSGKIEPDLLASALRLREDALKNYLQGREIPQGDDLLRIQDSLLDAEFPLHWLDTPGMPLTDDMVTAVQTLATLSPDLTPIRRRNLNRIHQHLGQQTSLMADALELNESGLIGLLNGQVRIDEQRLHHIVPRLVSAGLDVHWLDTLEAPIPEQSIQALRQQALDGYEKTVSHPPEPAIYAKVQSIIPPTQEITYVPAIPHLPKGAKLAAKRAPIAKAKTTKASLPAAPVAQNPLHALFDPAGDAPLSKEKQQIAVNRLDTLFNLGRRGVKKHVWETILGKTQSLWSVAKKTGEINRDHLATIEKALNLPEGWLTTDNPAPTNTLNLPTWFSDPNEPLPGAPERKKAKQPKMLAYARPGEAQPKVAPRAVRPITPQPTIEPSVPAFLQSTPAPTPASKPVVQTPAHSPTRQATMGPIATALYATLDQRAQGGLLSEQEALRILTAMLTPAATA